MKKLYAPWRSDYASSVAQTKEEKAGAQDCIFCTQFSLNTDDEHFILKRFKYNCIMLNRYPYNAGHLLIIPFEHRAELDQLDAAARSEMMELASKSTELLRTALKPDGFNIGFNLGKAAGAGIPAHLHMHILPRWSGDTNFLPTLSDTKQISFDLGKMFKDLKPYFEKLSL